MRNWGILVTAFYVVVVLLLLSYGMVFLAEVGEVMDFSFDTQMHEVLLVALIPTGILVCGQILLMFLSVDTSWRRLRPRRHAKVTAALVGLMVGILFLSALFAIGMAHSGDNIDVLLESLFANTWLDAVSDETAASLSLTFVFAIWVFWGVVFYIFSRRASNIVDSAVGWLIKGSVLELLIAVPCHIIVRQREWCCAQYVSAYGIAAGIAIMLMAFGPSALLLYKRKLSEYKDRSPNPQNAAE